MAGYSPFTNRMSSAPMLNDGTIPQGHLAWYSGASESLKGTAGSGDVFGISTTNPSTKVKIGGWKAIGGMVNVWFTVGIGDWNITLPVEIDYPGPAHLSNFTTVWANGQVLTINATTQLSGQMTYKG